MPESKTRIYKIISKEMLEKIQVESNPQNLLETAQLEFLKNKASAKVVSNRLIKSETKLEEKQKSPSFSIKQKSEPSLKQPQTSIEQKPESSLKQPQPSIEQKFESSLKHQPEPNQKYTICSFVLLKYQVKTTKNT